MTRTFAGPICVESNCKFGLCEITNAYLDRVACDAPIYMNYTSAIEECCLCEECEGISFVGMQFQPRAGLLREGGPEGVATVMRIYRLFLNFKIAQLCLQNSKIS
ncbi:hypothetical protein MHBO_001830 [Bonamia ostreae]|uniref:Uncharacterized protein n=1 Tax=Bonamia ostreae TaxID=126728 RepID=A0ABV2AKY3_9EUKA